MCSLRLKTLTLYLAGMLLLSACSSDYQFDEPTGNVADEQFYISFNLTNVMSDDVADSNHPSDSTPTRAGESKLPDEYKIRKSSIVALLCETDANDKPSNVVGIATGDKVIELTGSGNSKKLVINMGAANFYQEKKKYRLFVFANLPAALKSQLSACYNISMTVVSKYLASYTTATAGLTPLKLSLSTYDGLPMATEIGNAIELMVYLREGDRYNHGTPETAYIVQANSANPDSKVDSHTAATLMLTPLYARADFLENSSYPGFSYPISYTYDNGTTQQTKTEVYIDFKFAHLKNVASSSYLLSQQTANVYSHPTNLTLCTPTNCSVKITNSINGASPAFYMPENCPVIGSDNKLTYAKATYIELDGKISIPAGTDCDVADEVRAAINPASSTHPDLCYYDDGTFQSALMVWDSSKTGSNWHKLSWETKTVDSQSETGYWVTYRHAIRHGAVGTGSSDAEDGVVYPMEYGIVRNHIYQIGIASVSALPHPWSTTTPVESVNSEINVTISTPQVWKKWHREAYEIQF